MNATHNTPGIPKNVIVAIEKILIGSIMPCIDSNKCAPNKIITANANLNQINASFSNITFQFNLLPINITINKIRPMPSAL
ncbi:hypothetical protein [Metasolibacillus sp. FSL K6-0083]|uniref:hypothetical protein n=1 Tax=Metasolibacillus sp. FSL K6-0083 TaxID=2921416 RepID=UPI00315A1B20